MRDGTHLVLISYMSLHDRVRFLLLIHVQARQHRSRSTSMCDGVCLILTSSTSKHAARIYPSPPCVTALVLSSSMRHGACLSIYLIHVTISTCLLFSSICVYAQRGLSRPHLIYVYVRQHRLSNSHPCLCATAPTSSLSHMSLHNGTLFPLLIHI
jgi:hypothetical protein